MRTREKAIEFKNELNNMLKNVRNIEDVKEMMRFANSPDYTTELVGKRRGYEAYSFAVYPWNNKKVHYLYADSISTGLSRYENLYKVLKWHVWFNLERLPD